MRTDGEPDRLDLRRPAACMTLRMNYAQLADMIDRIAEAEADGDLGTAHQLVVDALELLDALELGTTQNAPLDGNDGG